MFTDTIAKTLSHMKVLTVSNPWYSVRAQHPHLKVREVGTHPGEHTESVTTLSGPDFICPYLKVTADNCLKASAVSPMPIFVRWIPAEETMPQEGTHVAVS